MLPPRSSPTAQIRAVHGQSRVLDLCRRRPSQFRSYQNSPLSQTCQPEIPGAELEIACNRKRSAVRPFHSLAQRNNLPHNYPCHVRPFLEQQFGPAIQDKPRGPVKERTAPGFPQKSVQMGIDIACEFANIRPQVSQTLLSAR